MMPVYNRHPFPDILSSIKHLPLSRKVRATFPIGCSCGQMWRDALFTQLRRMVQEHFSGTVFDQTRVTRDRKFTKLLLNRQKHLKGLSIKFNIKRYSNLAFSSWKRLCQTCAREKSENFGDIIHGGPLVSNDWTKIVILEVQLWQKMFVLGCVIPPSGRMRVHAT